MLRSVFCFVALVGALPCAAADKRPKRPDREPPATAADKIRIHKDFKVELLYSVPKDQQGSWVNMTVDPKGRLITSDQYGSLYRITPPALGAPASDTKVEKINLPIGEAQGLLWVNDSLYVVVNRGGKYDSGLYRVRSTKGDDHLDEVKQLYKISNGAGEHGPHAVILGPDKKSLYVVCGNITKMLKLDDSRVPRVWGEDHLLPRMPDGNGFMAGHLGPGGCIYKTDLDGKHWELISTGYRNPYDIAFNHNGDLFTYDADMEWDFNTPWYRPTRVCLAASGSEFGWRNGTGKWPAYYPDSLPAVVDIGPGSPTGITFGYGAKFPARYQEALFLCDWSYGKLYAVHLTPEGSSYKAQFEEFLSGSPLPLTDVVVNPKDGALYFTIGGRKTKSGLYRVTYTGSESTAPAPLDPHGSAERAVRRKLEAFHGHRDPKAVETAWPYLKSPDRYLRYAARVAIEHQDPKTWQERALAEKDPESSLQALLALVRVRAVDPAHNHGVMKQDEALKSKVLAALERLGWDELTDAQRLELLRVYAVTFVRLGRPDDAARKRLLARLDGRYPSSNRFLNSDLCQLLVYLEAPDVVAKTLKLLANAPTQEEQIDYVKSLRMVKSGWTPAQRKQYFQWFLKAAHYKGGASFGNFVRNIKNDALKTLTEKEKVALKPILEAKPDPRTALPGVKQRPFVRKWKLDELTPLVEKELKKKRSFDRGRRLFGEASCFSCHRFANEGGAAGPDLTGVAGRFSVRDLLESILDPSKEISDQYAAVIITTTNGQVVTGRIINFSGDAIMVMTNMLDPNGITKVSHKKVESVVRSKVSMMPVGMLDTFHADEVADLVAYLLSGGDRNKTTVTPGGSKKPGKKPRTAPRVPKTPPGALLQPPTRGSRTKPRGSNGNPGGVQTIKPRVESAEPGVREPGVREPGVRVKPAAGLVPENVAKGRPATASSSQSEEHRPGKAVDGDRETRWCADGAKAGSWWQVDLGKAQELTGCRIIWEFGGRAYRYRIEGSPDGRKWSPLVERTKDAPLDQVQTHSFRAEGVRFFG